MAYTVFPFTLILPFIALMKAADHVDPVLIPVYFVLISAVTIVLYRLDKRRAQSGLWRIPELTLHMAELIGGWGAAFAAQRIFRHKISKRKYQMVFWLIVLLHQYLSIDYISGWRCTEGIFELFQALPA